MFNQLSGINAIPLLSERYFRARGLNKISGDMQAVTIGFTNLHIHLNRHGHNRPDRTERNSSDGSGGNGFLPAGVAGLFATDSHPEWLVWLLVGFIAFSCILARSGDLGLLERGFPKSGASQGPELGEFFALDYERADFQHLPRDGGPFGRPPVCILRADDGGPVLCCPGAISRDEGFESRRDGASFGRVAGKRFV